MRVFLLIPLPVYDAERRTADCLFCSRPEPSNDAQSKIWVMRILYLRLVSFWETCQEGNLEGNKKVANDSVDNNHVSFANRFP